MRTVQFISTLTDTSTGLRVGFRTCLYVINEISEEIRIDYEKILVNNLDEYTDIRYANSGIENMWVRKGRMMQKYDVNGVPIEGEEVDEYDQWIQILTNQIHLDPRPLIEYAINEKEGLL